MKIRSCALSLLFVAAVFLTGCWDRQELNDLAIAVGLGLDSSEQGTKVITQVVNPGEVASKKGSGVYSTPVTSFSAYGKTTFEALSKLTETATRNIFSSHLRVLIIGESLARHGLKEITDGISRNREFRTDFYVIIAKGTSAENVLGTLTPVEKIPANKMFVTLDMSEKFWAPTVKVQLDKMISDFADPSKGTVLTGIQIVGDPEIGETKTNVAKSEPYALLKYSGIGLLKDGKLVDWMDEEESKGYNYITGHVKRTVGSATCPDGGTVAVEVIRSKSRIKGKIVDGKPEIFVSLFVEENIGEVQCQIDLLKQENIQRIENISEDSLQNIMESAIHKAQQNQTDIFGFGDAIEAASPRTWLKLRKDWGQHFAEMKVTVKADMHIRRLGTTNNSILVRRE